MDHATIIGIDLMRCALISSVLASALLYPCWASAAMVLGVS